ncbi:MAG: hypothetical protein O6944_08005 [Gammaproteobacteria bacterium]|nr:hypothetical protein [Gammaproteobacteria bacterium]
MREADVRAGLEAAVPTGTPELPAGIDRAAMEVLLVSTSSGAHLAGPA